MQDKFEILKTVLPILERNVLLSEHTTFKIGGPAEYFFVAKTKKEVVNAITIARKLNIPLFVFGGGSNLLVSDSGVKGLVVKIDITDYSVEKNMIMAGAGVDMKTLVDVSLDNSLQGLEWAGGLPGTFGGAIRGNAGAFGGEMKDSIFSVEALDQNLQLQTVNNKECRFDYRTSLFKKESWIILSATVSLKEGDKDALRAIADSRIQYRKDKHPLEFPSAGSVFKNIAVEDVPEEHMSFFADKVKQDPFPIVPAAWFIIGAGLTGKQIGDAQISSKHSNYIVNKGKATASDVLALINTVKSVVYEKYGVSLEQEVQFLGE